MNKSKVILFYELCRLCLEKSGVGDMFETADLIQDIFLCTGVKVTKTDNLPRKICMKCLETVVNAKRLRVLARANEMHLKSLFDDENGETDETEQMPNEEESISRNSSLDSDKTITLETSVGVNKGVEEKYKSNKRCLSGLPEHSKSEAKRIAVRKDLFDSSSAVTSSTKDIADTEPIPKVKTKNTETVKTEAAEYVCDVCKKKFSVRKKYYLHQRSHNRKIFCPLDACGKKFASKGDLEKHIRTHTGERPYRCEICDRSFAQRGTLKVHRDTVHAEVVSSQEYII